MNLKTPELRASERFVASEPLTGMFGTVEVTLFDLGALGAQIEHAHPLRLGIPARLSIRRDGVETVVNARVVWSKLSQTPNQYGKYLYRSGLRIEEQPTDFLLALHSLARGGLIRRDPDALERKRQYIENKQQQQQQRQSGAFKPVALPADAIPADQARIIRQARSLLRTHPEEAQKWYNRARYASNVVSPAGAEMVRDRDEVLAVWEYLQRTVPIPVIVRVFELG
jgi:hypothetical protein